MATPPTPGAMMLIRRLPVERLEMLGKLFNLGAASGSGAMPAPQASAQRPFPLESVQEDIHTRHLLFPDPQDLYENRANQLYPLSSGATTPTGSLTAAFDYNADTELDVRDVRIIIMQDALSSVAASLLYDSQPPPHVPSASIDRPSATAGSYSVQEPRRAPISPRKPSVSYSQRPVVIQPGSPKLRQGAFDRRPSVHSRSQGLVESESQRAWREYREELATFSSCIFGNSELMGYKGTSTKVHVVPSDVRQSETASGLGDGRGSLGRSTMRASRLSQSFSSENPPPFPAPPSAGGASRTHDRKKVLITRLFPVNLPLDGGDVPPLHGAISEENTGYPSAQSVEEDKTQKKKFQPRQKRTPMYAVALIITLPPSPAHSTPATSRSAFKGPSSYAEQDSFPSSFSSARRSGWTLVGQGGYGGADALEPSYGSDMEDQIDAITQHWDIIMRTLSHLQSVVATTLFTMLRQADLASPDPLPALSLQLARSSTASGRRGDDAQPLKTPKTNAKHITLLPNCLLENRTIGSEIDAAKTRIVAGIRASRVTTGQNRWPIWREEARWVAKWAGGKEQAFFFFNLLTGFLATHTDWLQALSPPSYRRRHLLQQQQKGRSEEDTLLPARTVLLSDNKIAARRLVFLLSAFLPASQQLPTLRAHRPSTPASLGALSQSPPSFVVPILKEESLRRKINRRTGSRMPSHSRNLSLQTHSARAGAVPPPLAHLSMEARHERRASDAASIRTSHLPIRGSDPNTRKSSAATTATITPETSIPHFSTVHRPEIFSQGRPGSSNSVAADDLKRLTRDESPGSQSSATGERRQSSRWSVISGLWSARRRGSASNPPAPNEGQGGGPPGSPAKARKPSLTASPKLASAAATAESSAGDRQSGDARGNPAPPSPKDLPPPPPGASADPLGLSEQAEVVPKTQRTPDPSGAFESSVKTSINIDDGVIDVDVPLPDFITSFESAVSSPSSSGYLSASGFGTGLDAFEHSFRFAADGDVPLNVAGWLQYYHPDFVLQALPAQDGVLEQIKASMRAEPTPPLLAGAQSEEDSRERWVDVTSAIVADTTTFTITRIRYRRLVKVKQSGAATRNSHLAPTTPSSSHTHSTAPPATQAADPPSPTEVQLQEEFIEEPIVVFDDVLIDAVERVIAAAGTDTTVSKVSSTSSSRSTSKRREREGHAPTERRDSLPATSDARTCPSQGQSQAQGQAQRQRPHHELAVTAGPQEVPRSQCKTVLLSALEDIIQDVIAEREELQQQPEGPSAHRTDARDRESPLRQAVRGWIESVDSGDGNGSV
ncbi:c24e4c6a-50af-4835-88d6-444684482ba9 [Thermothielavioides terrestris]|uniref:C24e4c6a-50af-4835-88d6-444684482ba9 n=1 Tax=Thermothielavioides terrestris TaxID=2587410 RepID=A0A3S4EZ54_9PEZI|nr:c24e4c6a-50af-4835-88d6-444684482ba9 [Thermothielavioides terrestris]